MDPALLIIDVQKGLDDPALGERNNPGAEANMARLLGVWREKGMPVIHVKHDSMDPHSRLRPELPGNAVKEAVAPQPEETQFTKSVNCAFVGTELEAHLRERDITDLVLIGLTTDHCVSATARMAGDLGFRVTVVSDATAAHEILGHDGVRYSGEQIHRVNLVSLQKEFADIRSTEQVLAALS